MNELQTSLTHYQVKKHHFTTIINSAPFAEQGILRLS